MSASLPPVSATSPIVPFVPHRTRSPTTAPPDAPSRRLKPGADDSPIVRAHPSPVASEAGGGRPRAGPGRSPSVEFGDDRSRIEFGDDRSRAEFDDPTDEFRPLSTADGTVSDGARLVGVRTAPNAAPASLRPHGVPTADARMPRPEDASMKGHADMPTQGAPATSAALSTEALLEFGPLAPYLANEAVTDLFVNGTSGLWVDDGARMTRQESWQTDERSLRELAVRLIALGGRHVDESTPCVDVRLRDGMRVHAVLPPISTSGTLLSIRVPRVSRYRLDELAALGTVSAAQLQRILLAVRDRANLLITGAGGSGKTTMLSAILAGASDDERIVTIEDVAELHVRHPHVVALEARQANLEGAGEIGMARLVREALRMRPDRLVVGECRGAEIRELLAALNTGHDGGAGTLHANSLADVPARIEALGALAGMSQSAIARQTVSAIGLVLHLTRRDGARRLDHIGRFRVDEKGQLAIAAEGTNVVERAGSVEHDEATDRVESTDRAEQAERVEQAEQTGRAEQTERVDLTRRRMRAASG